MPEKSHIMFVSEDWGTKGPGLGSDILHEQSIIDFTRNFWNFFFLINLSFQMYVSMNSETHDNPRIENVDNTGWVDNSGAIFVFPNQKIDWFSIFRLPVKKMREIIKTKNDI